VSAHKHSTIPEPSLGRLHRYLLVLQRLGREGEVTISSAGLGREAQTSAAPVRKDVSYLGCHGQRGVGYDVERLLAILQIALGRTERQPLVIVGAGNLGMALAGYTGFEMHGYRLVGIFDANPARVGHRPHGLLVRHMDKLAAAVQETGAQLAMIAVPAAQAQKATDQCVAAGLRGLLNFAPTQVRTPQHIKVRQVNLSEELQILNYQLSRWPREKADPIKD